MNTLYYKQELVSVAEISHQYMPKDKRFVAVLTIVRHQQAEIQALRIVAVDDALLNKPDYVNHLFLHHIEAKQIHSAKTV